MHRRIHSLRHDCIFMTLLFTFAGKILNEKNFIKAEELGEAPAKKTILNQELPSEIKNVGKEFFEGEKLYIISNNELTEKQDVLGKILNEKNFIEAEELGETPVKKSILNQELLSEIKNVGKEFFEGEKLYKISNNELTERQDFLEKILIEKKINEDENPLDISKKEPIEQQLTNNPFLLEAESPEFLVFRKRRSTNEGSGRGSGIEGYCPSEKGGSDELYGVFSWPKTMVERRAIIACPYDPKKNASRRCVFRGVPETFGEGFIADEVSWDVVDADDCPYRSARSKDIYALSQKTLNSDNVNETSQQIRNLSSSGMTLQPGDIGNIATILEKIVGVKETVNEVVDDFLVTVDNILDADLQSILQSQQKANSSSRIAEALNTFVGALTISSGKSFQRTLKSFAVDVSLVQPRSFHGLTFAGIINDTNIGLLKNTSIGKGLSDDKKVSAPKVTTIRIPSTIFNESSLTNLSSPLKIIFTLYKESKFFLVTSNQSETESSKRLNSYVIAGSIKALSVSNLRNPVEISFANLKPGDKNSTLCSFWNFTQGNWSQEGCEFRGVSQDGRIICSCNHLTNFAMLMDVNIGDHIEGVHDKALSIISYIGCAISLVGLILTIITILIFKKLRSKAPTQILLNFCIALSLTLIVFLAAAERSKTSSLASCRAGAIALHYFVLAVFVWMGIQAFNMYLAFVKVIPKHRSHYFLKCCLVGWGLPAVIVIITAALAIEDYGDKTFCRIKGLSFQLAFLAPALLILVANAVAFFLILRSLLISGTKVTADKRASGLQQARRGAAILVVLGLTWIFGVFAVKDAKLVFQYLFCIFNSIQGLLVFIFYCLLSVETRTKYKRLFCGKRKRKETDTTRHYRYRGTTTDSRFHEIRPSTHTKTSTISDSPTKNATDVELASFSNA